ncbi:hypothetical protein KC953_03420 [Candidatus Saccharibacteria bacterium]|nr:hypothetical protein [Candidatus Saccharibacteria bacterium]
MEEVYNRRANLAQRHCLEASTLFANFLKSRPDIDPNFIDDMDDEQEADWQKYSSDLAITQDMERHELEIEINGSES